MVAMDRPQVSDPFRLDGKTALVTGANTGIGQAIAIGMAGAGAEVIGAGRSSLDQTLDLIAAARPEGPRRSSSRSTTPPAPQRRSLTLGPLDILVNNAGIIRRADAVDYTEADWDAVIDVNLKAVFFLCQAFARPAFARQAGGAIVNIASLLAFQGGIRIPAYTASKHGVAGLTKLLANEWAAQGHQRQRHRAGLHRDQQHRGPARRPRPQPRRSSTASPPAAGARPPTSPAPPSSSPRPPRSTSTARSSRSMEAGLPADLPRLARPAGPRPGAGIVHLGLGAFFRAHGAIYVAEAMAKSGGDWGIVGVSLVEPDPARPPRAAGLRLHRARARPRRRDPPRDRCRPGRARRPRGTAPPSSPPWPTPASASSASPSPRRATATSPPPAASTATHPDIVHDLAHPDAPRSAPGFLVARPRPPPRRRACAPSPCSAATTCPRTARVVRGVTLELARLIDPALADWIEAEGAFPSTMVDRIVPATKPEDIARLAALTGALDLSPVMHEPFRQWVVEDRFVDGARPDLGAVGVQLVDDVTPFELMKLRCLNGTHSSLAYLGYLAGHETIADTVADPAFAAFVRHLWRAEIIPSLAPPPGEDLGRLRRRALRRATPTRRSATAPGRSPWTAARSCRSASSAPSPTTARAGRPCPGLTLAVAAWMHYVGGVDERGAADRRARPAGAAAAGAERRRRRLRPTGSPRSSGSPRSFPRAARRRPRASAPTSPPPMRRSRPRAPAPPSPASAHDTRRGACYAEARAGSCRA